MNAPSDRRPKSERPPMGEKPTVVFVGAARPRAMQVAEALRDVALVAPDRAALATARGVRVALVDLVGDVEGGLRVLEDLRGNAPDAQLVALAAAKDPDLILRAMRAGAREFVVLDEEGALAEVVASLARRATASEPAGQIISLFPAKGGVGATTLATSLAGGLASDGAHVVVVDFDRHLGDVLVALDMPVQCPMSDVLKNAHRFDRELLHSTLGRHASGLFVLTQADYLEDGEAIGAADVPALLRLLVRHFDYVVCDGLRGFDEVSVAVLDASNRVELVVVQEVSALRNAQRCLHVFSRLGYGEPKVGLLVNRYQKGAAIDLAAIGENLGVEPRHTAANDYAAALGALDRGVLLQQAAPRSKLTRDITALAADIRGAPAENKRGGLLRALFGRGETSRAKTSRGNESENDEGGYDESERAPEAT